MQKVGGMFGYVMGGAAIGLLSVGAGTAISTAIGTSTTFTSALGIAAGGATFGVISGGGFVWLSGCDGSQIFNAA